MPPTLPNQGFESFVTVQLGLCWDPETQMPTWMKGKIFQTPDVLIKLSLEPSLFLNEAFLIISLKVSKTPSFHLDWLQVITFCPSIKIFSYIWTHFNDFLTYESQLKGVFSKPSGNCIVAPNLCFLS